MKKYLSHCLFAISMIVAFTACSDVPAPYSIPGGTSNDEAAELYGEGTKENPYNVKGATVNQDGEYAWVKAYIVGFIPTDGASTTISYTEFTAENAVASNLVVAADPNEVNFNNCFTVQLPSGSDARAALNLKDNPGNLGCEVYVYGTLERYCGTSGLKNTSAYIINGEEGGETNDEEDEGTYLFKETFANSLGNFTIENVKEAVGLDGEVWQYTSQYKCAKATSYKDGQNFTCESWLISPSINLSNVTVASLNFDHAANYFNNVKNDVTVWVREANTTEWKQLTVSSYPTSFTFVNSGDISLTAYVGKSIQIGFKYVCTEKAGTYEVKNFVIKEVEEEETPVTPDEPSAPITPTEGNILKNGDFETWNGSTPTHWTPTTTAGNATLAQSSDAHTGSYAVLVKGGSGNYRLAYKEITLTKGTYTLNFFAKAATAESASIRPGHTVVVDGKAKEYKYGSYTNDLSNETWTEVTHSFTLEEETTVNIIVMNSKTPGKDVLIDDIQLTTTDGAIVGGDDSEDEDPEGEEDTPTDNTQYTLATAISAGTYVIATETDGSYKVATPLTGDYGYLKTTDATASGNILSTSDANEFTLEAADGGFYIKDGNGKYYHMTGTYNSCNVSENIPTEGAVWNIEIAADGTATVTNVAKGKTMQYDTQYSSYGIYPDDRGIKPKFFKKN